MKNHKLDVYLNQVLTGQLSIDTHGDMVFFYNDSYLEDNKNQPLSQSLPFQKQLYNAKQCRPFFSGILPEEAKLSKALVLKEAIHMLNSIQAHITDSPFTATILQRAEKLSQRFRKIE